MPCPADNFRNAVSIINFSCPFCQRREKGAVIYLLKGLSALIIYPDLTNKQNHGRAVLHGGMHPDRAIGCPGPAGNKANAGLAGQLAPCRSRKAGCTFMPAQGKADICII